MILFIIVEPVWIHPYYIFNKWSWKKWIWSTHWFMYFNHNKTFKVDLTRWNRSNPQISFIYTQTTEIRIFSKDIVILGWETFSERGLQIQIKYLIINGIYPSIQFEHLLFIFSLVTTEKYDIWFVKTVSTNVTYKGHIKVKWTFTKWIRGYIWDYNLILANHFWNLVGISFVRYHC